LEVKDYWVQPKIILKNDTTWQVQIYIGRPGNEDINKHFEIKAFIAPKLNIKEGDVLKEWPQAKCSSEMVEVIRK